MKEISLLKNFANFIGKHLRWSLFFSDGSYLSIKIHILKGIVNLERPAQVARTLLVIEAVLRHAVLRTLSIVLYHTYRIKRYKKYFSKAVFQILLGPFLNTFCYIIIKFHENIS